MTVEPTWLRYTWQKGDGSEIKDFLVMQFLPIIKTIGMSGIPWSLGVAFAVDETSSLFVGSSSILSPIGGSGVPFFSSNGTGDSI